MEIFNHPNSPFTGLGSLCDGIIRTEDGYKFLIHRAILATESQYFKACLGGEFNGGTKEEILIPGISGLTFMEILTYIYTMDTNITSDNLGELLVVSDYLSMDRLSAACCAVVDALICPGNCLELLNVSLLLDHLGLHGACFRYTQTHFSLAMGQLDARSDEDLWQQQSCEPAADRDFQEMRLLTLRKLLESDLNVDSEEVPWAAIVRWISAEPRQRSQALLDLMLALRLDDASEELIQRILAHPYVQQNELLMRLVAETQHGTSKDQLLWALQELSPAMLRCGARHPSRRYCRLKNILEGEDPFSEDWEEEVEVHLSFDDRCFGDDAVWYQIGKRSGFEPAWVVMIDTTICLLDRENAGFGFELTQRRWFELPAMSKSRIWGCSVVGLGRSVYCFGGQDASRHMVERWELGASRWVTDVRPMPVVLYGSSAACEGRIYSVGFEWNQQLEDDQQELNISALAYDPWSDSWTMVSTPGLIEGYLITMAALNGCIFVSSSANDHPHGYVERYDIGQDVWTTIKVLPEKYIGGLLTSLDSHLVSYNPYSDDSKAAVRWVDETEEWQEFPVVHGFSVNMYVEIDSASANRELRPMLKTVQRSTIP